MMVKTSGETIQAFPITPATYIGVASNFNTPGFSVIHAAEDGTITFEFGTNGGTKIVNVVAGQDLAIHPDCISLTATATVWIS